ncbi:hypothetical protein NQ317_010968 [Molorchus minor]|uniref:Uncharacterized protein n=1 Tax=Molorchus minor TaxID=1323400 RepID=A0ABQ9J2W3_9CUCU|nr:hypothetical protein NQ317_010968 [Molorchus minor]
MVCVQRGHKGVVLQLLNFSAANIIHLKMIKDMGINIIAVSDGRVQLLHTFSAARSTADAEEGLLFMQDMVELSKLQAQQPEPTAQAVTVFVKDHLGQEETIVMRAGPAQFGINLKDHQKVQSKIVIVKPFRGCGEIVSPHLIKGNIAIMEEIACLSTK